MRKCEKCGATTELPAVTISMGPETRVIHLCSKHITPVERLFELGHGKPEGEAPAAPTRPRGHAVIPID